MIPFATASLSGTPRDLDGKAPNDTSIRPDLLNASGSQLLKERGVTFIEHCQLQRFEKSKWRVVQRATSQGTLPADGIVIATDPWSSRLTSDLECPIRIKQGKAYSVTMSRPAPCPRHPKTLRQPYWQRYIGGPATDDGKRHFNIDFSYGGGLDPKLRQAIVNVIPKQKSAKSVR